MDDMALLVTQDLKFYVMGIFDEFLNVDSRIPKSFFGLRSGSMVTFYEGNIVVCNPHPPPSAAGNRLDHDRIPNFFGYHQGILFVINNAVRPWRGRNTRFFG